MINSVTRGGGAVYLDTIANQIAQPSVTQQKTLTGEEPVIVAEWEVKEFVWFSKFLNELPPLFEDFLETLDIDPEDYSCEVGGFYRYYHKHDKNRKCDVQSVYVPVVRAGKYHPYTSVKHRRRASSRTLDRLEFLEEECRKRWVKFDYVIKIDLTFPKSVSRWWDDADVQRRIRDAVKDFLRKLHRELFGERNSQFGAISNHHYWASKSPLEPHRHIHLTLPNVVYNKRTDMFHRIRPFIEVDLVRRVWKSALRENGLWLGLPDYIEPDIYVAYVKFEERNKVVHRLSYCCRKPIEDLVRASESDYDFRLAVNLDDFDRDFVMFLLDYTPRVVNLGFMTNLKRFGYNRKSNFLKCPICGGDMMPERDKFGHVKLYDRPPPDLPSLYRSRAGEWLCLPSSENLVGGELNG